jgi:hypothetical protein
MKAAGIVAACTLFAASARADGMEPFNGQWIALGASHAWSAPFTFSVRHSGPDLRGHARTDGYSGVAATGHNWQYGTGVIGVELAGRFGAEDFAARHVAAVQSFLIGPVVGTSRKTFNVDLDSSIHAALRIGAAFDQTMLYAKVGAGIAHSSQSATASAVIGTISSFFSASADDWTASLIFGVGLEHNFGRLFGRIEAQAEAVDRPNADATFHWSGRGAVLIGVRF